MSLVQISKFEILVTCKNHVKKIAKILNFGIIDYIGLIWKVIFFANIRDIRAGMHNHRKQEVSKVAKDMERVGSYNLLDEGSVGEIQIADEVVAIIAGLAATEVEGVASMAGNVTNELVAKLGMRNLAKGVKVDINPESVVVDMALNMEYGFNIPKTSEAVQERVKNAIENMTGLHVTEVNIRIAGVAI